MDAVRDALSRDPRRDAEIAAATGIHVVNLRQFRAGKRGFPLPTLAKLAKTLGLELVAQPQKK